MLESSVELRELNAGLWERERIVEWASAGVVRGDRVQKLASLGRIKSEVARGINGLVRVKVLTIDIGIISSLQGHDFRYYEVKESGDAL